MAAPNVNLISLGRNALKMVPAGCRSFCASTHPTRVLIAETDRVGGVDGLPPKGVEGEANITWRKPFLRQVGYKL